MWSISVPQGPPLRWRDGVDTGASPVPELPEAVLVPGDGPVARPDDGDLKGPP